MKQFAKLFVLAFAITLLASLLSFNASAVNCEPGADPNELKPGSDKVVFIKDAPRDDNYQIVGELSGDGTGTDADNPLKATDHEKFDPNAERKRYDYTTAFYQATELLEETGGTIVICGPVYLGINECADNGASNVRDAYTANFKNNVIKFTSVYDCVDYRETAGAKLTICTPAMVTVLGSSIWENIDIETIGTDRAITFDDYCTLVGEGVECYPSDEAFEGVAQNYVSLGAGHRHAGSKNENPTLTVKSGTYYKITAAMWGTTSTATSENTNTNLTLEGTTTVLGIISGTVQAKSNFSGNVKITINSGTYACDINAVGPTGMTNADGTALITINGGNFIDMWSINQSAMGATNNLPAACTLDFTGWTGDDINLAYAVGVITDITDVKLPEGKTADYLANVLATATKPADTDPPATEPPATEPHVTEPVTTDPVTTDPTDIENDVSSESDENTAPETDADNTAPKDDTNYDSWIWVASASGILAVAAVVFVMIKKKQAK